MLTQFQSKRVLQNANAGQRPSQDVLTSREHAIAVLSSRGLSNKEIARRSEITEGTVKTHLHNIYQKTRVSNRTALAALMLQQPG